MQNGRMVHLFRQNLLKSAAKTWMAVDHPTSHESAKAELLFAAADLHISVVKHIYPHVGARNTWGTMSKDVKGCQRGISGKVRTKVRTPTDVMWPSDRNVGTETEIFGFEWLRSRNIPKDPIAIATSRGEGVGFNHYADNEEIPWCTGCIPCKKWW